MIDLAELADDNWVETMCGIGCCTEAPSIAFKKAGFVPHRTVEADEYWPAQGFVAAGLGVALIPTLGLGVLHESVVVRRLRKDNEPLRHVWAATRPAASRNAPVQTMLKALQQAAGRALLRHSRRPQRAPHVTSDDQTGELDQPANWQSPSS